MDPLNAIGLVVEVVKSTSRPVVRRIYYRMNLRKNMKTLTEKNKELMARETDIRSTISRAEVETRMASERALVMLENIEKAKGQVKDVSRSVEGNRKCFLSCALLKIAKGVIEVIQEVDRLLTETSQFANELVVERPPPKARPLVVPILVGDSTMKSNLDAILESLRNPVIGKIGVYAMGGSGKTASMKNIYSKLAVTNDFDKIIWVTVSKDLNLDKLQNDIAQQLSVDLSTCVEAEHRAGRLFESLKHVNKFLIVFDDMWERIPLDKVGIPEPDMENKCKILLTTRSLAVCNDMETHKNIKLALLSKEEAWKLFVSKASDVVYTLEVQPYAEEVVSQCGGLPLAINTVARALRNEVDISVWRKAVKDLQRSPTKVRGMEEDVFELLRFSYDRLKNDKVRKCFLYCALFPEDYKIDLDDLITLWMAEIFVNEEGDMESERDEGSSISKELSDACMVEKEGNCIRMHDCLRDLAIGIMEDEGGLLVKAGLQLTKSPKENEWNKARRVSLIRNEIKVLPKHLKCPDLLTLLLQKNPLSQRLSCSFFSQMPRLQVLDLSYTRVSRLPSSLFELLNLRALLLDHCHDLEEVPSVAKLRNLRILNLRRTGIKKLPQGMEQLISLRCLDLSSTYYLKICRIPKLPRLEELHMQGSKIWEMESPTVAKCLKEVSRLNHLMILTLSFTRLVDLNASMHLQWGMLKNFAMAYYNIRRVENVYTRISVVKNYVGLSQNIYHPSSIFLPPNTQEIRISSCEIPRLSSLLGLMNLKLLKRFYIGDCSLNSGDSLLLGDEMEDYALPSLQNLQITRLEGLAVLWKGVVARDCLINLRGVFISQCKCLKNLFFLSLLQHLKNIEVVRVSHCQILEKIVYCSDADNATATTTILLPRLHSLSLFSLPELQYISEKTLLCDSLCKVEVWKCPKLKKLPFSVDNLPNLEKIIGEPEWWEALEWGHDAYGKKLLQPSLISGSDLDAYL